MELSKIRATKLAQPGSKATTLRNKNLFSACVTLRGIHDQRLFMIMDQASDLSQYAHLKQEFYNVFAEKQFPEQEIDMLGRVFDKMLTFHQNEVNHLSGELEITHRINTAKQLVEWGFGPDVIAAALLQDIESGSLRECPPNVLDLIERIKQASFLQNCLNDYSKRGIQYSIEMLLLHESSVEVWAIIAACQLELLNSITTENEKRITECAYQTYYKTAHILSLFNLEDIATTLEDIALFRFDRDGYNKAKEDLLHANKRLPTDAFEELKTLCEFISEKLKQMGVAFRLKNDLKGVARTAKKRKRGEEITDPSRFRVIISGDKKQCKQVFLTVVNEMSEHRFSENFKERKNYIDGIYLGEKKDPRYDKGPKENGYESIQTNFCGTKGEQLNIQVRTEEMDQAAELGSASKWKLKEDGIIEDGFTQVHNHAQRLKRENRRYGIDEKGTIYRLIPDKDKDGKDKAIKLIDLAYAISPSTGRSCPDFIEIIRLNTDKVREERKTLSAYDPLENGDCIIFHKNKKSPKSGTKGKADKFGTLNARLIFKLAREQSLDSDSAGKRSQDIKEIGKSAIRDKLAVIEEELISKLNRSIPKKQRISSKLKILYSLERVSKFLGLGSEAGLELAVGLLQDRNELLDQVAGVIKKSSAGLYYNIEGGKMSGRLIVQNHAAVYENLLNAIKDANMHLSEFDVSKAPDQANLGLLKFEITTSDRDPEAAFLGLINKFRDLYRGIHTGQPEGTRTHSLQISFFNFGIWGNILPEVLNIIAGFNMGITSMTITRNDKKTFYIIKLILPYQSADIEQQLKKRLKKHTDKNTIRKLNLLRNP